MCSYQKKKYSNGHRYQFPQIDLTLPEPKLKMKTLAGGGKAEGHKKIERKWDQMGKTKGQCKNK